MTICKHCKKPFQKNRSWQVFCSAQCRNNFHNSKRGKMAESTDDLVNKNKMKKSEKKT